MEFLQLRSLINLIFIAVNGYVGNAANVCTANGYKNETSLAIYDSSKTHTNGASKVLNSGQTDVDNITISLNRLYRHTIAIETVSQEPASTERPPLRRVNKFTTGEISLLGEEQEEQNTRFIRLKNASEPKDRPYAVGLVMYKGNKKVISCSGTLISSNWVLTAAKCLYGCDSATVYAGLDIIKGGKLPENTQMIQSSRLFPHPHYQKAVAPNYDVGVVELEKGFNLTENVQPISLSMEPWSQHGYQSCEVTAYRRIQADENEKAHKEYRKTTQQLGAKKPCACSFSLEVISQNVDKFICTRGRRDISVCDGDPGSGLVCGGKIRAVASFYVVLRNENVCQFDAPLVKPWGRDCGRENTLSVFHDTCPYLSWINGYTKLFNDSHVTLCNTSGGDLRTLNLAAYMILLTWSVL